MELRYYDPTTHEHRIKRRYVWAFWSFVWGAACGSLMVLLLR